MRPIGEPVEDGKSLVYTFTFPAQEHKIRESGVDPATEKTCDVHVDDDRGIITMRRSAQRAEEPLPAALIPGQPIPDWEHRNAVQRFAEAYLDGERGGVVAEILERRPPQARLDLPVPEAALSLDGSYLFVQGPPGSGKTWQGAKAAVALMRAGRRVGVTSLSHKAISKLLEEIEREAREQGFAFRGRKKSTAGDEGTRFEGQFIDWSDSWRDLLDEELQLVAGTSWLFARADFEGFLDTLIVDEAGQVSLADVVAVGHTARNLVLLGDPNQLPQVSQGAMPEEAKASGLQHLLGEETTVPPDRGIFLERTWRLRPELTAFTSEAYYEGRLVCEELCGRRSVAAGNGLVYRPVEHAANGQLSREEAAEVARRDPRAARHGLHRRERRDPSARARRRPRRDAVQRTGADAAASRARGRARRHRGQVPGAGGAGRHRLARELERGGGAARARLRLQQEPDQRRDLARAVPRGARLLAAPARGRLQDRRGDAARERALPLRRAGARPGLTPSRPFKRRPALTRAFALNTGRCAPVSSHPALRASH